MIYKDFFSNQKTGNGFQRFFEGLKTFNDSGKLLFLAGIFMLSGIVTAQTESEPNNDSATADVIAFGATGNGYINPADDDDYWQLTTTENGKIKVDFTHSGMTNQYTRVTLYSSTLQNLASEYTNSSSFLERDGLAAGTYYIKVDSYYSSHTHGYSINPSFISISTANDTEPNGTFSEAQVLALNGSLSGQVGYREYNDNPQDAEDWFSVTTNAEGRLDVSIETHINEFVYVYLYDGDGTSLLDSEYTPNTAGSMITISKDGLAPGQYFMRVKTYYSTDFAPYTLSNTLTLTPHPTEGSGNDTYDVADTFALNSSINGLIGYAYNGNRDAEDWYKVSTNAEGELQLTVETLRDEFVYVYLYDGNGTTQFASDYTQDEAGATKTISKDGLAPGDYYVRIKTYYSSNYADFAPYTLTNELILPPHPTEGNGNDTWETAQILSLNGSVNGLVGYYYNGNRDLEDWYSVTTDANGKLQLSVQTLIPENVYVYLYDGNGTTLFASDYTDNTTNFVRTIEKDGLAPGEYYVRVKTYYSNDFAPYILSNSLIEPDTPEDANDDANDEYTGANLLALNTPHFGHIGYKYIDDRDNNDWYQFTWSATADFRLNLKVYNNEFTYIQLYQSNGTTLIDSEYTDDVTSINVTNLTAGNYYVRVRTYYSTDFAPYRISTGIDTDDDGYADVVDCAPDDATIWQEGTFYLDEDGDGYHGSSVVLCYGDEAPEGYSDTTSGLDCNDNNSAINPGAEEICDGIDNNCNGQVDEGVQSAWHLDSDEDGYGDPAQMMMACAQPEGYVTDNTDCNDADAAIHPGASEIPGNDIDENCDGEYGSLPDDDNDGIPNVDDNCPSVANADQADLDDDGLGDACDNDADGDGFTNDVDCDDMDASIGLGEMWYADADGDGFGDAAVSMTACTQPAGYVADNTDCNDANASVYPGATEILGNGIDENCDGADGTLADGDNDGIADINDNCPTIANADQADLDDDGLGDACDDDADGDGYANDVDCDDMDASIGLGEMWYADADGDGFGDENTSMQACTQPSGYVADNTDCDDSNSTIYPGAAEIADDGIDQDCDGSDLTEDEECVAPTGVVVTRLSATTASFTADDTSAAYQGSANRAGRPLRPYPMYGMDNISSGHVQSGLVPQFEYDIWFRTICTDGTFTEWVGPFYLPVHGGVAKVSNVKLTPNPAVQMVKVDGMEVSEITIFDQYGRLVLSAISDSNEFNVEKLQSGIYTVQLKSENGEITVQQLIKK